MSPELFALAERLHGHLAWLGLAVLLHPVITLRRRGAITRGARISAAAAAALIALPFALGWWLYPTYRQRVKPELLQRASEVAMAFETKEHLAWMCLSLTLAGAAACLAPGRDPGIRRAAWALLAAAWLCGAIAGGLGVFVAANAHPGW